MSARRRGTAIGLVALVLAGVMFLGSLIQFGLTIDEALAQSSVRPPDNAVVDVRPPAPEPSDAPAQPGAMRVPDAVPAPEGAPRTPLAILGPNSDATLWGEIR